MNYTVKNKLNQVHAIPSEAGRHTADEAFEIARLVAEYEGKTPVFYVTKENPIYIWKREIL